MHKRNEDRVRALINSQRQQKGLRGKINAKCIECAYDDLADGKWREQVTLCKSYGCPLWEVRPVSKSANLKSDTNEEARGNHRSTISHVDIPKVPT